MRSTQTMVEVQPRDILTASELTKVRGFLRDANKLVTDVRSLFLNSDISFRGGRLADESSGR